MSVPIKLRDDFSAADIRTHARCCKDGAQVRYLLAIATILTTAAAVMRLLFGA